MNNSDIIISHSTAVNRRIYTDIHFHNDYEIYYLINGNTTYFIGDEIFYIRPGSFVFIPKSVLHKTDSETCMNNERFLINLNINILDEEIKQILKELCGEKVVCISKTEVSDFIELIDSIENEYQNEEPYKMNLIKHYVSELFIMIYRKKHAYKSKLSDSERIMQNVSEYVKTHFSEELTLKSLSEKFAMSESYLSRKFKFVCGIGLCEYITSVRITNAKDFLKNDNLSISEAAFKCGFNDSNYFSSVFKKFTGKSPLQYLKTYRSAK